MTDSKNSLMEIVYAKDSKNRVMEITLKKKKSLNTLIVFNFFCFS